MSAPARHYFHYRRCHFRSTDIFAFHHCSVDAAALRDFRAASFFTLSSMTPLRLLFAISLTGQSPAFSLSTEPLSSISQNAKYREQKERTENEYKYSTTENTEK